ncbi:MAG: riboflavin synthase [Bacteroidota bacterium]
MFSGIVETVGEVIALRQEDQNLHLTLKADLASALKIDQSIAHNGVCLTVVEADASQYTVTAIAETLERTNLGKLTTGDGVNLERCVPLNGRIDGHLVQGHVDQTGTVEKVEEDGGSWRYFVAYDSSTGNMTVPKGSICVNGVSLTVVDSTPGKFSVAIIPYTYEHTTFRNLREGDTVNLEFDVLGKYVVTYLRQMQAAVPANGSH